jgi:tRNA threonylcarbamoyladenosine biosynthesis protein TsaB
LPKSPKVKFQFWQSWQFWKSDKMLILGIDTSGKSGGVTLAEAAGADFRVLGSSPIAGGTFSAQLVPTVATLLQQTNREIRQLDAFAVVSGPGSFTGLRVGLSAVKGLAEVLEKPIVAVSLLEALASLSPHNGRVIAALDAGRSEIFFGLYEVQGDDVALITEQLLADHDFMQEARKPNVAVITSDEAVAQKLTEAQVKVTFTERPDSSLVAKIGARKLAAGDITSVEALDANYLRRSDAELFFKGSR